MNLYILYVCQSACELPLLDAMIFLYKSVEPADNSLRHAFSNSGKDIISIKLPSIYNAIENLQRFLEIPGQIY